MMMMMMMVMGNEMAGSYVVIGPSVLSLDTAGRHRTSFGLLRCYKLG